MDLKEREKEVMEYVLSTWRGQRLTWEEERIAEFVVRAILTKYDLFAVKDMPRE